MNPKNKVVNSCKQIIKHVPKPLRILFILFICINSIVALRFFLPTIIIYPPANTVVAYGVYLNNWITEEDLDKYVYAVVKGQFKDHYKDNGVVKIYYPLYKRSSGANELDIGWSVMEGKIIYGRLLWIFHCKEEIMKKLKKIVHVVLVVIVCSSCHKNTVTDKIVTHIQAEKKVQTQTEELLTVVEPELILDLPDVVFNYHQFKRYPCAEFNTKQSVYCTYLDSICEGNIKLYDRDSHDSPNLYLTEIYSFKEGKINKKEQISVAKDGTWREEIFEIETDGQNIFVRGKKGLSKYWRDDKSFFLVSGENILGYRIEKKSNITFYYWSDDRSWDYAVSQAREHKKKPQDFPEVIISLNDGKLICKNGNNSPKSSEYENGIVTKEVKYEIDSYVKYEFSSIDGIGVCTKTNLKNGNMRVYQLERKIDKSGYLTYQRINHQEFFVEPVPYTIDMSKVIEKGQRWQYVK